jgi:geranylgeranyl pyrophosphate synthase
MIDDALNIGGEEKKYRKEIGGDVREGKRTLLTVWALSHLPTGKARELGAILHKGKKSKQDIARAVGLIKESGAVDVVMERAERRVRAAMRELAALPGSQAKRDLEEIARYITRRNC